MSNSNNNTNGEEYETGIPVYVKDLIEDIAKKEGFKDHIVEWASGSNHGDNFMGIMSSVLIKGYRNNQFDELPLMVKLPPTNAARRKQFHSATAFTREIIVYEKLFPLFSKFQSEKGVNELAKDGFNSYPKCYATVCDPEQDRYALIMEDIRGKGFSMFNKFEILDFEHSKLILRELGKLHALSYALRDQQPDAFKAFVKFDDVFMRLISQTPLDFVASMIDKCAKALEPDEIEAIEKLEQLKSTYYVELESCLAENVAEPFSVINHGDCWNNNMMYSYDKDTKKPKEAILLDFQISRFASPVLDITYFIFSSTTKALRDAHYYDLIQIYYDSLSSTIKALGSDPEKCFSLNDFEGQLKQFGKFGLLTAIMILQAITVEAKDLPDIDELAEKMENNTFNEEDFKMNDQSEYAERLADVLRDSIKYGYV